MNLAYVLDTMTASGYPIPDYIHYRNKEATVSHSPDMDDGTLDSREKVWLAAVKSACVPMAELQRNLLFHKIAAAASRYGILPEIEEAVRYVERLDKQEPGIRTVADFRKAAEWLREYADTLTPDIRAALANHLLDKTIKLGHVLSVAEQFELDEWAGRDPYTPELRALAERNLHKLASGNVYRTDQFAALSVDELRDSLPDLVKTASLGMNVVDLGRLAKCAATLPSRQADILDALFVTHGQQPIHSDYGAPVEIDDAILASL